MTFDQIETALGQHLAAMPSCPPIAWPNKDANPARPFLAVQHVPTLRAARQIQGNGYIGEGFMMVTVVAARDTFAGPASVIAQALINRFPQGLRLLAGAGRVLIHKPAEPMPAFRDGPDWRQPVRIAYRLEN
jgi:hypothetical protein